MFAEIEFEANEETNKMTDKECGRDIRTATSLTTAAQGSTELYHLNYNFILPEL